MLEETEIRRRVAAARVARLATVDPAGRPHLVPICFVLDGDVLYSAVDEKPKRSPRLKRLANVRANPAATVLVDAYDEDWSRLWWVRLDGRARVLEEGEERERALALALLAGKYPQYRAQRPRGPVLALTIGGWRSWAADVLVHGEPERNDMVEYFAEQLDGFAITGHGWVQSYGSRCVKPPILYGDVSRPEPMTVRWWRHAQSPQNAR